jgi:sulfite exporter TauE/SafE/copper chaperone CopZ
MKTYEFNLNGMHCKACAALTETELEALPEVHKAKASFKSQKAELSGDFGEKTPEQVAEELNIVLKEHGYFLSVEKNSHSAKWEQFKIAAPIAIVFVVLFWLLQKMGIVNLITSSEAGYETAFAIGLVASVSSCMAVVGGLVLSMSATFAKEGDKIKPQIMFHGGRIASFFILGGVVGAIGSAFQLGGTGTFILSLLVGLILLVLGINLLDVFPWAKRLQPTLPVFLAKKIHGLKNASHFLAPLLAGVATFFLPCGFTQSMQIYALSTGSFFSGAMTMLLFALGTLPALLVLSFSSLGVHGKSQSGIFFKTAGLIVLFFGIINVLNSLAAIGAILPILNF